jgi:cytochrome c oxidase cbb3-type subunit 3
MNRWLILLLPLLLAGCEREDREYRPDPAMTGIEPRVTMSTVTPGVARPAAGQPSTFGEQYESNAYHVSQGKKLYVWFNCNGCHANGGGDSGPPLMDGKWIYGGSIDEIVSTILEGRPNGMPSFRGKVTDDQVWQLAAFVRSLGGNLSIDTAPGRNDDLNAHPPENQLTRQSPTTGGAPPANPQ